MVAVKPFATLQLFNFKKMQPDAPYILLLIIANQIKDVSLS